jgi:FkbM family methyltransferase
MLYAVASKLDALGLRPWIAKVATLAYPGQTFSVDQDGYWVNEQLEGTIVSPVIHTAPYAGFRKWVMDNWTFCYTPKLGDVLVDLGTGIGEEAVVFSKLIGPDGLLVAVEAHPIIYKCLTKTVSRSSLDNVRTIHCAIGDSDGEVLIDDGVSFLTGSTLADSGSYVPQLTLDTLCSGLERIDFLRTNIEGAERLMLGGMQKTICKTENICISCHDFLDKPEARSKADVMAFLDSHGLQTVTRPDTSPPMCDYVYATRQPPSRPQSRSR